eukprot:g1756.t1
MAFDLRNFTKGTPLHSAADIARVRGFISPRLPCDGPFSLASGATLKLLVMNCQDPSCPSPVDTVIIVFGSESNEHSVLNSKAPAGRKKALPPSLRFKLNNHPRDVTQAEAVSALQEAITAAHERISQRAANPLTCGRAIIFVPPPLSPTTFLDDAAKLASPLSGFARVEAEALRLPTTSVAASGELSADNEEWFCGVFEAGGSQYGLLGTARETDACLCCTDGGYNEFDLRFTQFGAPNTHAAGSERDTLGSTFSPSSSATSSTGGGLLEACIAVAKLGGSWVSLRSTEDAHQFANGRMDMPSANTETNTDRGASEGTSITVKQEGCGEKFPRLCVVC